MAYKNSITNRKSTDIVIWSNISVNKVLNNILHGTQDKELTAAQHCCTEGTFRTLFQHEKK